MKPTELRIGNYVSGVETEADQITEILDNGVSLRRFNYQPKEPHHYFDWIEPIPLTEEWLKKLGFQFDVSGFAWYTSHGMSVSFVENRCVQEFGTMWNQLPMPKYVHSLQNLFYCLTGEELTLQNNQDSPIQP